MIVKVIYSGTPVASFDFSAQEVSSIEDALELAWRHTNNVIDSWSLAGSEDSHPSMTLLQPRPIYEGREMGHRSSMMGDVFKVTDIDGGDEVQVYVVAMCGFDRIG